MHFTERSPATVPTLIPKVDEALGLRSGERNSGLNPNINSEDSVTDERSTHPILVWKPALKTGLGGVGIGTEFGPS
ncbi:MAG: hypothetical protein KDB00_25865, partial [Planctomycetales bacterium]|nr:hypothetical protein [Planctomycetales bacterium]